MKKTLYILTFLITIPSLAQTYSGPEKDIQAILENVSTFSQNVMKGDYKAIAASYTTDGKIFPNNRDIMEGTAALESYWKPSEGWQTTYHKVTPKEIKVLGDEAYDYGYYEGTSKGPDRNESNWKGKYVITWKKVNGEWKIYLDIWNSIKE